MSIYAQPLKHLHSARVPEYANMLILLDETSKYRVKSMCLFNVDLQLGHRLRWRTSIRALKPLSTSRF